MQLATFGNECATALICHCVKWVYDRLFCLTGYTRFDDTFCDENDTLEKNVKGKKGC